MARHFLSFPFILFALLATHSPWFSYHNIFLVQALLFHLQHRRIGNSSSGSKANSNSSTLHDGLVRKLIMYRCREYFIRYKIQHIIFQLKQKFISLTRQSFSVFTIPRCSNVFMQNVRDDSRIWWKKAHECYYKLIPICACTQNNPSRMRTKEIREKKQTSEMPSPLLLCWRFFMNLHSILCIFFSLSQHFQLSVGTLQRM